MPMYYEYPNHPEAYAVKNQYYFGTELMAAPITTPRMSGLNVAKVTTWLPEGTWYDIHTGMVYEGNRMLDMYRGLESIPVLAKAGAILPVTDEISAVEAGNNPHSLRLKVFAGADGAFTLYEDDNTTCDYEQGICATTKMTYKDSSVFTIEPVQGDSTLVPEQRAYTVELTGYAESATQSVRVMADGEPVIAEVSYEKAHQAVIVKLLELAVTCTIQVTIDEKMVSAANDVISRCFDFLNQAEIAFQVKDAVYHLITTEKRVHVLLAQLQTMNLEKDLYGVLVEILTAR